MIQPTIDTTAVGSVLAGISAAAIMLAIYALMTLRHPMARRVKALNERREQLKAGITAATPRRRARITRGSQTTDMIRGFLERLRVLQDSQLTAIQQRMAQAGIRKKEWGVAVILARMVGPIVIGLVTATALFALDAFPDWSPMRRVGVFTLLVGLAYKGPDLMLGHYIAQRTDAIRKGLPDALDLLVICAEAGLTVDAAFSRVARELGRAWPELGDEFALTAIELSFLTERRLAFEHLAWRINIETVKGVVATLIQTERYGTPLASALRVLAAEFRNERMMRAEEKAARLPALMTVPLIVFILPALFVAILGPAACSLSDNFINRHG